MIVLLTHLEVAGLHPRHETINEASDVLTLQRIVVILEIVDDVLTHGEFLLRVCGGEVRHVLVQPSHVDDDLEEVEFGYFTIFSLSLGHFKTLINY